MNGAECPASASSMWAGVGTRLGRLALHQSGKSGVSTMARGAESRRDQRQRSSSIDSLRGYGYRVRPDRRRRRFAFSDNHTHGGRVAISDNHTSGGRVAISDDHTHGGRVAISLGLLQPRLSNARLTIVTPPFGCFVATCAPAKTEPCWADRPTSQISLDQTSISPPSPTYGLKTCEIPTDSVQNGSSLANSLP